MKRFGKLIIVVIVLLMFLSFTANRLFPLEYKNIIDEQCKLNELNKHMVYALIKTESNFNPNAASHKSAQGLMQLTEDTAHWCSQKMGRAELANDIYDPETNILIGCWYLSYLINRFDGSESAALAAYNAGGSNVEAWLKDSRYSPDGKNLEGSPFLETARYLKRVSFYTKIYKILY